VVVGVDDDDPTRIRTGSVDLAVLRVLGDAGTNEPLTLTATWSGQATPMLLAYATPSAQK
jgi:hypothetical protein